MAKLSYKAINVDSGEVVEGSPKQIAEIIGVNKSLIYANARSKHLVRGKWMIEDITEEYTSKCKIPLPILEDWDRTRKDIIDKAEKCQRVKRKHQLRKPQQI